jgi:hypothetical protein
LSIFILCIDQFDGSVNAVFDNGKRPRKRKLSPHQRQIRFFIGLSIFLIIVATIGVFLLLNWNSLAAH